MKLKDDDKSVLIGLVDGITPKVPHMASILGKFRLHGLVDNTNQITKRGRHVAASLKQFESGNGELQGASGDGVASQSGPGASGRNPPTASNSTRKSGTRSTGNTEKRPDEIGGGDSLDLQRANPSGTDDAI